MLNSILRRFIVPNFTQTLQEICNVVN